MAAQYPKNFAAILCVGRVALQSNAPHRPFFCLLDGAPDAGTRSGRRGINL
jgi:hypothetical protein